MGIRRIGATAALVVVAGFALSGCTLLRSFFGSSDAQIVSFNIQGIVGQAVIDPNAHTVTVTVEPIDVSAVAPQIGVSSGASIDSPTLVDGQPVVFHVTAENGTTTDWAVTVSAEYGMSFTIDGIPVVLKHGYSDSGDPSNNAAVGNDIPPGDFEYGDEFYLTAGDPTWDYATYTGNESYLELTFYGLTTGSYTENDVDVAYQDANQTYFESPTSNPGEGVHMIVKALGNIGSPILGIFAGKVEDDNFGTHVVANGFFKVLRLADDTFSG